MKKHYLKRITVATTLLITSIGFSQTDVSVSEDSFVRGSGNSATNYDGQIIEVKESASGNLAFSRRAFVKFDVSGFSAITSATLFLSGNQSSGASFDVTIYEVALDSWAEGTLTWDNASLPTGASTPINTFATPGDIDTVYQEIQVDVTSYVQAQLAGDKIVSMSFADAAATNDTFRFMDKDNTVSGTPAFLRIVGTVLGVEDKNQAEFAMYPNPVQDLFTIQAPNSEINSVSIFSVTGKMIFNTNNLSSSKLDVDTRAFQTGVYFVQVKNVQGESSVKRLIKN